ncbi:uncharacterized protein LOC109597093 [Aethina tumida]|uniref:uncharacterized protein LOC109597093 n=1 Tax=Aethina tumida TaxID=116153 RepID=UPI00096B4C3E|nr:uncharacterized protein LOC109597093 [Aethina tumida]
MLSRAINLTNCLTFSQFNCIKVTMGKNKKQNNVFKVAGAKSLKLKAKAKAVKTDLKNINKQNKDKLQEIDNQLVKLQDKIRSNPSSSKNKDIVKKKLPVKNVSNTQNSSNEALESLSTMQVS